MNEEERFGQNPYQSDATPTVHNSYVAFLDVLGFSSEIRTADATGKLNELLKSFRAALDEAAENLMDKSAVQYRSRYATFFTKAFSDNIVFGVPIGGRSDGESDLGMAVMEISQIVLAFMRRGFFLRGAIAKGEYYADNEIAFGVPLLAAVCAEKSLAVWPRVILLPEVVDDVNRFLRYYGSVKESPEWSYLLIDQDQHTFVNYMAVTLEDRDTDDPAIDYWFKLHRDAIAKRLSTSKDRLGIFDKYRWAAGYHNRLCALEGLSDGLRIANEPEGAVERIDSAL